MLELKNIKKEYKTSDTTVYALDSINLSFNETGLVFILGQSGSGKTTMLNILGGIDFPTSGDVLFDGNSLSEMSLESYRRDVISFVFQEYNLLPKLNVYENLSLVTFENNKEGKNKLIGNILSNIGLEGFEKRKVQELSGGQKQRVAVGRALAKNSRVLLCDEPTGNLDSANGKEIIELLQSISKEKLVIVVSHNEELANEYADRIIHIKDGKIEKDEEIHNMSNSCQNEIKKNNMSFKSILSYGLNNLFSVKFKTIIATLLFVLSLIAIGCMTICLTFSSEHINYKSSKDDNIEYIVNNSGNRDWPNTSYFGGRIGNIDSIIENDYRNDGYSIQNSVFYVLNNNKDITENFEYYFKEPLGNNSCYITDYLIEFILTKDNQYQLEPYTSFEDLQNTNVYYKGIFQYSIAGVIKTDYSNYCNEEGERDEEYQFSSFSERMDFIHKYYYEYKAIYGKKEAFDALTFGKTSLYYYPNNEDLIEYSLNGTSNNIQNIELIFNEFASEYTFFTNDGYFSSLTKESSRIKKVSLNKDEVVISRELYNLIFGENIDWDKLYSKYVSGMAKGTPYENEISHLNERVSFKISTKNYVIEVKDVVIVGVQASDSYKDFVLYVNHQMDDFQNDKLCNRVTSIIDWKSINNKYEAIKLCRNENMLLSGGKFSIPYYYEPYITYMLYFFIGVAVVFGLITIASIINLVIHRINDNKKEIGILYSAGCKKIEIVSMYMIPVLIISLVSLLITFVVIVGVCITINSILKQEYVGYLSLFSINIQTALVLFASIIITLLFSVIPLHNYLKKSPMEIIRKTY